MQQVLDPEEFAASKALTKEQKHQYLETAYQEHITQYRHILEKISSSH